jgi:hypothetical protein
MRWSSPRRSRAAGLGAVLWLVLSWLVLAPAGAAPPPPPGGHHALYSGGYNRGGYPVVPLSDAGDPSTDGLHARLSVSIHPNPFHGATTLRLSLRKGQVAQLTIYDLSGKRVREFVQPASQLGSQEVVWDGRDNRGQAVAAGAYVYRVESGAQVVTGKLVLLH